MSIRVLRALILITAGAFLLVLTWPQALGLQNSWVIAQLVSFRALAVLGAVVAIIIFALLLGVPALRRLAAMAMVMLALFSVANLGILSSRGFAAGPTEVGEQPAAGSVTVLSWNTLGDAPGAAVIAALAVSTHADVITLPETTEETGVLIAERMREAGRPMWVHTVAFDLVSKARSTTVLISPELGDYVVSNAVRSGPSGNTAVLPTVVAEPADGSGPTIVAVHAVSPIRFEMSNWRSDLDWIAAQCEGDNVIVAGDFNATLDHLAGRGTGADPAVLGNCADAALSAGAAAVGTWPTWVPALLGSPIDRVMATPNWRVSNLEVIESFDDAGSDHRPLVATFAPAD